MKIIFKNKQEFLNTLYGDEEDYSYITNKQIKEIIKDKLTSLDKIYEYIGDTEFVGEEQYDLGDCANLIQLFKNIEFEEDEFNCNNIYDNGALMLGEVKKIKEYTQKLFDNGLVDEEFKVDILNDLKDYKDNEIVAINYDCGMGYSIDCWSPEDIIKEND